MERGRIMAEWARTRPGGLVSILGLSDGDVRGICREASPDGKVDVAVVNAPGHTVIAGEAGPLGRAVAIARERGARVFRLPISVPSHTPIMQDAAREMSRFIATLRFRDPETPIVSNISANLLTRAEDVRRELADQISHAVEWARCVVTMHDQGADAFVELGPGQTLTRIIRRIRGEAHAISADGASADDVLELAGDAAEPASRRRVS
jgi:[acyl-carrier-protein] S-malonyltransferase